MIPALSIRAPWAWLIIHGRKTIENRDWNTGYRGRFQVHSTATRLKDEYAAAQRLLESAQVEIELPPVDELVYGAIIGTVFLDRISRPTEIPSRWGNPESKYWWHLVRPCPWTPDPCPGGLGWFFPC